MKRNRIVTHEEVQERRAARLGEGPTVSIEVNGRTIVRAATPAELAEAQRVVAGEGMVSLPHDVLADLIAEARYLAEAVNDPTLAARRRHYEHEGTFHADAADVAEHWLCDEPPVEIVVLGNGAEVIFRDVAGRAH